MAESHSQNMFRNSVGSIALCMALTSAAGCNAPATVVADDSSETEEPAGEPDHANLLIHETSPYLLQHAHNPVNWHPWGPEAFAKAKKEGKPIFLSVGYSTCYWCHVMERQSFEKQDVADILNKHFIPIKVDREERPDVDEQYMLATQIVTGRGGWPNSVWLTPDGQPWMAGTYFPREQFKTLLTRLADIWETRRDDVDQQADRLTELMQTAGDVDAIGLAQPPTPELLEQAITEIVESFDEQHGGFGDAPKFPPHGQLRLLVHEYQRTNDTRLLDIIRRTLDAMQAGGIRDHLGGGFHRYSTDRYWLLPHFEKMLYDNAQLMRAYTDGYLLTRDDRYRLVVADISEWLQRKMTSPEGAFYSAIDSESEQEEGRFYVWRKDEIIDELGTDDGELFSTVYGVRSDGNFRDEATGEKSENNILHLPQPLDEIAAKLNLDEQQLPHRLHDLNTRMLNLRGQRVSPHLDDKILVAWNALMIESLAYSGRQLERPEYTTAAAKAAEFVLLQMTRDGRLLRSWRAGQAKQPAFLDDYAFFASALIELHLATGDEHWLTDARRIADLILTEFQDAQHGGFYFTSSEHPDRLARSRNLMGGGNIPSGNGVAAQVLLRLDAIESTPGHRDAALRTLHTLSPVMWRSPSGADSLMLALADAVKAGILPADRGHQSEPDEAAVDSFDDPPIRGRVFADERNVTPGQSLEIRVVLDIDDGWHLYGPNPAADFLIESTVELLPSGSITIKSIERPAGVRKDDALAGQELLLYAGRAHWLVTLDVAEAAAEKDVTLEFQVTTQACDQERCLPPKKNQLHLPLRIRRVAESNTAN